MWGSPCALVGPLHTQPLDRGSPESMSFSCILYNSSTATMHRLSTGLVSRWISLWRPLNGNSNGKICGVRRFANAAATKKLPLAGLKVLDMSRVLAGVRGYKVD